jgi:hypothetical protein
MSSLLFSHPQSQNSSDQERGEKSARGQERGWWVEGDTRQVDEHIFITRPAGRVQFLLLLAQPEYNFWWRTRWKLTYPQYCFSLSSFPLSSREDSDEYVLFTGSREPFAVIAGPLSSRCSQFRQKHRCSLGCCHTLRRSWYTSHCDTGTR